MAVLFRPQHIARAPDFQVPHGNLDAGSQFRKFPDGLETLLSLLPQKLIPLIHKECIGGPVGTPHPASQLIQLGQPHAVRIMDNHGIGIGYIQAGLNDGGGHQHVNFPVDKIRHNPLQLMLPHLAMGKCDHSIRHKGLNTASHLINIRHTIVYIIHLTVSCQLAVDCLTHHLLIVFHHIGLNGSPVHRRLLQHTHIAYACQAHMKGPGNRRGCQGEYIHIFLQVLDLFLMGNAKPLLLVNNQQSQVLKLHILGQDPVGADYNVHHSLAQVLQGPFLPGRRAEPAQHIHPHRKILHPLHKCIIMLLGQNRGWHQVHHLLAVLDSLKCSPQGHLRLTVPHITANQAVHDSPALHILLHRVNGIHLVIRLIIGEQFLKLSLPHRIRSILESGLFLARRIKLHQILGNLLDSPTDPGLGFIPLGPSQLVELRFLGLCSCVFLDALQTCGRQIQIAAVPILNLDIVLDDLIPLNLLDALIYTQAVLLMDHIIPHGQLCETLYGLALVICLFTALSFFLHAEHIALCDKYKLQKRIFKSPVEIAVGDQYLSRPDLADRGIYSARISGIRAAGVLSSCISAFPFPPIRAIGPQVIFPQVAGKPAGPGPGSR